MIIATQLSILPWPAFLYLFKTIIALVNCGICNPLSLLLIRPYSHDQTVFTDSSIKRPIVPTFLLEPSAGRTTGALRSTRSGVPGLACWVLPHWFSALNLTARVISIGAYHRSALFSSIRPSRCSYPRPTSVLGPGPHSDLLQTLQTKLVVGLQNPSYPNTACLLRRQLKLTCHRL